MEARPSVFVGSSSEGLDVAEAVQRNLEPAADITLWSQGVFGLSHGYLESLMKAVGGCDFAILVLTADDLVESRGQTAMAPRDNVLFELGLFMGRLGRERCFFVFDKSQALKLPTDLLGIAAAQYQPHRDGNLDAALGSACTKIKQAFRKVGPRPRLLGNPFGADANAPVPNLSGTWAGYRPEQSNEQISVLEIRQYGSFVQATVRRQDEPREFAYEGRLTSGQLVLFFEDTQGVGYIVGTMVLHLSGDLRTLEGRTAYYNHDKREVMSSARVYRRVDKKVAGATPA